MHRLSPEHYFNFSRFEHQAIFDGIEFVWDAVKRIADYIQSVKPEIHGQVSPQAFVDNNVCIGPGTQVEAGATIKGPSIIGKDCRIYAGAFIRENVIMGNSVLAGRNVEIKNSLLFDEVAIPHFNYVGDSILGWRVHLGAGVKIANMRIDGRPVRIRVDDHSFDTGMMKFGAVLGDEVEIGCNAVVNPGTCIGRRTMIYANVSLHGYYPPDSIVKLRQILEVKERD